MIEALGTVDKLAEAIKLLATNGITIRIEGLSAFSGFPITVSDVDIVPEAEAKEAVEKQAEEKAQATPEVKRTRKSRAKKQPEEVTTTDEEEKPVEEELSEEQGEEVAETEAAEDLGLDLPEEKPVEKPKATVGDVREALIKLREKHGDLIVAQVFQRCGCKNMRDLTPDSFDMALEYAKKALAEGKV